MIPLGPRLAVQRLTGERVLASGIVLPAPDSRHSQVGVVRAVGTPHVVRGKKLPLDRGALRHAVFAFPSSVARLRRVDCFPNFSLPARSSCPRASRGWQNLPLAALAHVWQHEARMSETQNQFSLTGGASKPHSDPLNHANCYPKRIP